MATLGIEMHLRRNLGILQSLKVHDGILHMHRIVLRLNDKSRRSLAGYMNIRIRRKVLLRKRQVARIDDDSEIGTAADLVRGIDRIVKSMLEVSAERRGKMGSCRESEHSDAMGINVPLARMRADDPEGSLRVLQCGRRLWDKAQNPVRDISPARKSCRQN